MLRDLAVFAYSVVHAGLSNGFGYYWDSAPEEDLRTLVTRLSNVEDKERSLIRRIVREIRPMTLLDVACGPATEKSGYDQYGLGIDYTGLDASRYMLNVAQQRHPDSNLVRANVQELPFRDATFDVILLKHILEHLPGYEIAVTEALRVARSAVIIDFFHTLLPISRDIPLKDRRGFHNNWYSRARFHSFLDTCSSGFELYQTTGTSGQTADVYVVQKRQL